MNQERDVVVVGAGMAGLCAARELRRCGRSFVVLEARDRVGGRLLSEKINGSTFDLGGQWIGPTQHRLAALAKELGVVTFPQHADGTKILSWNGRIQHYSGDLPRLSLLSLLELARTRRLWTRWARTIPAHAPWEAPEAIGWDSMTLQTWKERFLRTTGSKLFVDIITRAVLTSEPRDVSFLYFLSYLKWGEGLDSLISIRGGAQQARFVGGAQQLCQKMADGLGPSVQLSSPVRAVRQDASGVEVITDQARWRTQRVIIAIPPALLPRIDTDPPINSHRDALASRMPMGSVIKYIITYERPFWRDVGFSGEAFSDTGPTVTTFDDTSEDGATPALVSFSDGESARIWSRRPAPERKAAVLSEMARFFGPQALKPLSYAEKDWNSDPWSRGGYVGVMTPGTMSSYGPALREPCGRIHWSGTETATAWVGYMEGAIEAGLRAAREVHQRLS